MTPEESAVMKKILAGSPWMGPTHPSQMGGKIWSMVADALRDNITRFEDIPPSKWLPPHMKFTMTTPIRNTSGPSGAAGSYNSDRWRKGIEYYGTPSGQSLAEKKAVMVHEYGHAIDFEEVGSKHKEWFGELYKRSGKASQLPLSSTQNPRLEYFAEQFERYVLDPIEMKTVNRPVYDFFRDLLKVEYPQEPVPKSSVSEQKAMDDYERDYLTRMLKAYPDFYSSSLLFEGVKKKVRKK